MDLRKKLISWLRDAHAIELWIGKMLSGHARAAEGYPELAEHLRKHAAQSHAHAARIEGCLAQLDETRSVVEGTVGKILGTIESAATNFLGDPVVTNTAADYAAESLEISTYTALVAAAEAARQKKIADECRSILAEKDEMARWLRAYLPTLSTRYLTSAA